MHRRMTIALVRLDPIELGQGHRLQRRILTPTRLDLGDPLQRLLDRLRLDRVPHSGERQIGYFGFGSLDRHANMMRMGVSRSYLNRVLGFRRRLVRG
jgi:hypothetical protein